VSASDAHILVVEDDRPMQRLLQRTLELAGYRVTVAGAGPAGLALVDAINPNVVLLDMILPGMDGIQVCREIRARSQVPVVVISALGREQDKIRGLDAGADDYITKPFSAGELIARVKAVLRRTAWSGAGMSLAGVLRAGDLQIDLDQHIVRRDGQILTVTPLEFRLLAYLAAHPGRVLTHTMILQAVWGSEYAGELHMLRVNISRLRQKLERDPANPQIILTVPGVGYTVPSQDGAA
jgi:two-component system KDP operon response regulator KdpE